MGSVVVVLFWLWVGVSLAIYARRLLTSGSLKPQVSGAESPSSTEPTEPSSPMGTTTPRPTIDDELAEMTPPSMAETMAPEPTHRASSDQEASLVAVQTDDTPAARSLADALSGIQMPCDLAPLMTTDRINPRNMLFSTSGYPPEVVGRSVADELERLGFSFVPIDERALHAHRGSTALEVRVHPDKEKAAAALAGRAGSAAEDAVIVEFQLR